MTVAYRTIPNPVYRIYIFSKIWQPTIFLQKSLRLNTFPQNYTMYIHMLHYTNSKYFLTNIIIINSTYTNIKRILICSSVRSACTWKIVFKTQNNELNELNECMLYKMFCFFGKYLKTIKLSFTIYFLEALLAYFALLFFKSF